MFLASHLFWHFGTLARTDVGRLSQAYAAGYAPESVVYSSQGHHMEIDLTSLGKALVQLVELTNRLPPDLCMLGEKREV